MMVADILDAWGKPIDPDVAHCIYAGSDDRHRLVPLGQCARLAAGGPAGRRRRGQRRDQPHR